MERVIEHAGELPRLIAYLHDQPRPFTVKVSAGRPRSIAQNRLMWLWAHEASVQRQDVDARDVQSEWKLRFGIPLLIADDEKMAATWAKAEAKLTYEEQIELMEYMSVTSIMTSKQLTSFLDQVYRHSVEHGIDLTEPDGELTEFRHVPKTAASRTEAD